MSGGPSSVESKPMSKQTATKIDATAALSAALAAAINEAKAAGLSAVEIAKAIEPFAEILQADEE